MSVLSSANLTVVVSFHRNVAIKNYHSLSLKKCLKILINAAWRHVKRVSFGELPKQLPCLDKKYQTLQRQSSLVQLASKTIPHICADQGPIFHSRGISTAQRVHWPEITPDTGNLQVCVAAKHCSPQDFWGVQHFTTSQSLLRCFPKTLLSVFILEMRFDRKAQTFHWRRHL